jgi:hypothetical protein
MAFATQLLRCFLLFTALASAARIVARDTQTVLMPDGTLSGRPGTWDSEDRLRKVNVTVLTSPRVSPSGQLIIALV